MLLSPKDWLVLTPNGWKKLSSPEEVDDYINRKLVGILFVFDGIERKGDQQYIMGILYNSSRSESKPVEIPITPSPIGRRKTDVKEKGDGPTQAPNVDTMAIPTEINYNLPVPGAPPIGPILPKKFEN
jgi:hypothetical protein